jgi:hypothetical protein
MLILPPGHSRTEAAARRLSARERWMVRGVLGAVVVVALVVVISLATAGPTSSRGCIHATIPGPVGAEEIDQCGVQARDTCASVRAPGAFAPQAADSVAAECRKAGLPVGP